MLCLFQVLHETPKLHLIILPHTATHSSTCPPGILTEVLLTLSEDSFTALLAASPATCQVRLMPSFWRKRVEIHMSWSWEIIAHVALSEQSYNWEKIYYDLERFSKLDKTNEKDFLGFANRRRIYNVCRQLTPSYVQLENEAQAAYPTGDSEEMLRTAKCQHFVSVSMPLVSAFNSTNTFMLHRWSDIAHEEKVLEIFWNSSGALTGIALTIRGVQSAVEGSAIGAGAATGLKTDTLVIQKGDWIDGFLFFMSAPEPKIIGVTVRTLRSPGTSFGSTNGAGLRLMSVDNGNVFVGLKAAATTDSISKLGILECFLPSSVDLPLSPPKVDAATRKMIWKNQVSSFYRWLGRLSRPDIIPIFFLSFLLQAFGPSLSISDTTTVETKPPKAVKSWIF